MARLGRRIPVAQGTRVPVRVENLDGTLVALETTGVDGSWSVDVDPGRYRVIERWVETYEADAESTPVVQLDTTQWDRDPAQSWALAEAPVGSVAAARARRRETSS